MESVNRFIGRVSNYRVSNDEDEPKPREGIKNSALRLMGDLKNWAKEKLYKSPVGGLISRYSLGRAKKAVKLHTTAVELLKEIHSNIAGLTTGPADVPPFQAEALGIVKTQLDQAIKNKAKAEKAVRSSREDADLVTSSPKQDAAVKKFDESIKRLDTTHISRKDLSRMADQFKTNITKKFTPGIFTRKEEEKQKMNDVKNLLLKSVDDITADLMKRKETKKERIARNKKKFEENAGDGNLNMKRKTSESDFNKLKMEKIASESDTNKPMKRSGSVSDLGTVKLEDVNAWEKYGPKPMIQKSPANKQKK